MASKIEAPNQNAALQERLLSQGQEETEHDELKIKFKTYSLLIGLCCGVFVQLSTLGANFLLLSLCGDDAIANQSDSEALLFSLLWSIFTSCLALVVLALLRALVKSILDISWSKNTHEDEETRFERDTFMMAVEVRYVVGALMGVCLAWTCTDILLGMQSLALYSLCTLFFAVVWSKAMIWFFAKNTTNASSPLSEGVVFIV